MKVRFALETRTPVTKITPRRALSRARHPRSGTCVSSLRSTCVCVCARAAGMSERRHSVERLSFQGPQVDLFPR